MSINRVNIQSFLQKADEHLVIDVRSPLEYNHAHIPNAVNIPLFTDEERKIVGTTYKQESREDAIKIGLDFFGPKMRLMVEEAERLSTTKKNHIKNIKVYCWRGGMRSAAVAWLLDLYGFKVEVLSGGYKTFRNLVLQSFSHQYNIQLVGGFSGSGKTEILHELKKAGETVIDLEAIAVHKGSAFGNINMPEQPSQEMFENLLGIELLNKKDEKLIWIEDESQRIGKLNLPNEFWKSMRKSPVYFFDIPFEERLQHITQEYGNLEKERMIGAIERITKRLGHLDAQNAINFLRDGNIIECFRILLYYYDKHYLKGLHNREDLSSLLHKLTCNKVNAENALLLTKHQFA